MLTINLKMIDAGIIYRHDGNGRILKAWKVGPVTRFVLKALKRRLQAA